MAAKLSNFDVSEYLTDEESIAAYLSAIVEEGDPALLLAAIGDVAKARGMAKIASDSGLGRESLYKALNPAAKPRFDTIIRVLNSLGVKIGFSALGVERQSAQRSKPVHSVKKAEGRKAAVSRSGSGISKRARQKKKVV